MPFRTQAKGIFDWWKGMQLCTLFVASGSSYGRTFVALGEVCRTMPSPSLHNYFQTGCFSISLSCIPLSRNISELIFSERRPQQPFMANFRDSNRWASKICPLYRPRLTLWWNAIFNICGNLISATAYKGNVIIGAQMFAITFCLFS